MVDIASLAFGIDTSQVKTGISDLDGLSASSDRSRRSQEALTTAHVRFQQETANTIARVSQLRAEYQQTTSALDSLIARMDATRAAMNTGSQAFANFAQARAQVEALGAAFGQTSTQLEGYTRQASQIGLSSAQTVLSLQRVTDAMMNQTQAGQAIRQVMLDYGVSLQTLTSGNAAQALQSFADRMKTVADSATKFRQVQAVLGTTDPTTYARLNDPDYVPMATRYERQRVAANAQVIGDTTRRVALSSRALDQDQARYDDLSGTYNYRYVSPARMATLRSQAPEGSAFRRDGTRSQAGTLGLFDALQADPNGSAAQGAMTYSARIGQAYRGSWLQGLYNQSTAQPDGSTRLGSDYADIGDRFRSESTTSTGLFGSGYGPGLGTTSFLPSVRSQYRQLQAQFSAYTPLPPGAPPPETDAERSARIRGLSTTIGGYGYGDFGLQDQDDARTQLRNFSGANVADQYVSAYGDIEGARRYGNTRARLAHTAATAMNPGQSEIDDAATQAWQLSVPRAQRGQAQALTEWLGRNARDVDPSTFGGSSMASLLNAGGFGPIGQPNTDGFNQGYGAQQANLGKSMGEDSAQALARQHQLTEATSAGASSVEELTTAWAAYDGALAKHADPANANVASEQALLLLTERRKTAAQDLINTLENQTRAQAKVSAALSASGSSLPSDRAGTRAVVGIYNDLDAEHLKNPELSSNAYITARANALGQNATDSAGDQLASTQHDLDLQRQLLSVAGQRADVQAKMVRDQAVDKQFSGALGSAQAADAALGGHTTAADAIREAIARAKELNDELATVNATAAAFKIGNDANQSAANENWVRSQPYNMQGRARAQLQALTPFQTIPLPGAPGVDPGTGGAPANAAPNSQPNTAGTAALGANLGGLGYLSGGGAGAIPATQRLALLGAAVAGTIIPPDLLGALVMQESSWNPATPNGGLTQITQGTAGNPGYGMAPGNYAALSNPTNYAANLAWGAQYLQARGTNLGMTQASDYQDQTKVAQVLRAYNGPASIADPNYIPNVERYLPSGYFSAGGTPGAAVSPNAALGAAQANPGGQAALAGINNNVDAGIAGQIQDLNMRQQAQAAQVGARLPFIAANDPGSAAMAGAGVNMNPKSEPALANAQIGAAQQNVSLGQATALAGQVGGLAQSTDQANQLAVAYSQGQAAVDALTASFKAQAIVLANTVAGPQRDAILAGVTTTVTNNQAALANDKTTQTLKAMSDANDTAQYQNSLGPAIGVSGQQNQDALMAQYRLQQTIANTPGGVSAPRQQDLVDATAQKSQTDAATASMKSLSSGFTQMESAANSAFASAITGGGNLRSVLASLTQDIAKIAIQMALKPAEDSLGSSISSLFGGLFGGAASLTGTGLGIDGMAGTTAAAQASFNASIPLMSPGAAIGLSTGGVLSRGRLRRFGSGGVLNQPTTWMMGTGDIAMAGEMGNEAVMPLTRLPNGNLGVSSGGSSGGSGSVTVNTPITINGGQSGSGGTMDQKTAVALQKQIEASVRAGVKNVIANERRPGGDLYI